MTGRGGRTGSWWRSGLVGLAVVVTLAGCSNPGTPSAAPRSSPKVTAEPVKTDAGQQVDPAARQVAYAASEDVRVDDVAAAAGRAEADTGDLGGLVFAEDTDLGSTASALLTIKVPAAKLRPALTRFGRLGTVQAQKITGEDVSDTVVDVAGRLRTAQASADRLRGLLTNAAATSDVVALEGALQQRETEIESLTGQSRELQGRVAEATITLHLSHAETAKQKGIPGFFDGLRGGWHVLTNLGRVVLTTLGALLPFVPLLLLGGYGAVRYRRWRRAHPKPVRTPAYAAAWPVPPGMPGSRRPAPPPPTEGPPES